MEFQVLKCLYYLTCIQLLLFQVYQFCIIKTKLSLFQLQLLLLKFLTQHPCVKQCKFYLMLQQPLVTQGQMISQQAKLSSGLSSNEWGNYKRTQQGALAALLLYLYKYKVVHATTICFPHVHSPCFYLMSITHPPCVFLKATMLPTCALTSYL